MIARLFTKKTYQRKVSPKGWRAASGAARALRPRRREVCDVCPVTCDDVDVSRDDVASLRCFDV